MAHALQLHMRRKVLRAEHRAQHDQLQRLRRQSGQCRAKLPPAFARQRAGREHNGFDSCLPIYLLDLSLFWLFTSPDQLRHLRGQVLPIGGLKEKLLAAHRGGIKTVLIPYENKRDLEEIPDNVIADLQIHPVKRIEEVLSLALQNEPSGMQVVTAK